MNLGMMGQGMGPGTMMNPGMMEHQLSCQCNPDIKFGKDENTIVTEIVTKDGSLIQRLEVNCHTGWMRSAR